MNDAEIPAEVLVESATSVVAGVCSRAESPPDGAIMITAELTIDCLDAVMGAPP